jgi:hypothetical protein
VLVHAAVLGLDRPLGRLPPSAARVRLYRLVRRGDRQVRRRNHVEQAARGDLV